MRDDGTMRWDTIASRHRPGRRGVGAWVVLVAMLLVVAGSWLAGMRLLVEHSDSMSPALRTGDLLVVRRAHVADLRPGSIVSFSDPSRGGRLITHRVVTVAGPAVDTGRQVTTRGDANTATESVPVGERVWTLVVRVPRLGYLAAGLHGMSSAGVLLAGALAVAVVARRDHGVAPGARS